MNTPPIHGHAAPGFEAVRDAFQANFEEGVEQGASVAVILEGQTVVNLWGGFADRAGHEPWTEDTLVPVYSTTKGVAALVLARVLASTHGRVSYETPVAEVWPEFAAAGKAAVTIAELVSHQAGLPGFSREIDPALWLDPPACAAALAGEPPLWDPGSAHGYHPLSWGYLVGELVYRIDGRSLGTVLAEDFTGTAQGHAAAIDFHIGLPDELHGRVADILRPKALPDLGEINAATEAAFMTKWAAPNRGGALWRRIEIPSANGHGTARAVAELYGIYAEHGRLGDREILSPGIYEALTASRVQGQDLVLPYVTEYAAGVMRNNLRLYGPNPATLAHSGWGGSLALGDPDRRLSLAYVMNRQLNRLQADPRAVRLIDACYACLDG